MPARSIMLLLPMLKPGLAGFLVLSLLLHIAAILALSGREPNAETASLGDRRLVVELGEIAMVSRPERDRTPTQPLTSRPADSDAVSGESSSGSPSVNHLLGEIQTRLSRYLSYPPLARARGWQGTVTVGFDLVPDGRLQRIHIARSSGYDVLDRAAIEALARLDRLDENGRVRINSALAMRLPVIYRLTER